MPSKIIKGKLLSLRTSKFHFSPSISYFFNESLNAYGVDFKNDGNKKLHYLY